MTCTYLLSYQFSTVLTSTFSRSSVMLFTEWQSDRIRIWIFRLIPIRMSVGSVPKCRRCVILSGVSHFAKYGTNRPLIVWEMLTDVQNPLFLSGEEHEKFIRNPHADPDHGQKLTTFRESSLANACQVWSTSFPHSSVILFTEWQTGFESGFSD